MQRFSGTLFVACLAALVLGCGKSSPQEGAAAQADRASNVERDAQAIKLRTERDLEDFKEEAQDALRNVHTGLRTAAKKRSDEMSAFAAELAEEAKDRALDIPEVVDRALERHTRRWRESHSPQQTDEE